MKNDNAPHKAIITILVEFHQVMPNGQCSGETIEKDKKSLFLGGNDYFITKRKVNELLDEVKKKCQE